MGGFVQSEDNLSQEESCWIFHNAIVAEEAVVTGNAQIHDTAIIRGNALVSGSAAVRNRSMVEDYARHRHGRGCGGRLPDRRER